MATVTLVYSAPIPPTMSDSDFESLVGAVDVTEGELALLGMSVDSDSTAIVGPDVERTIVLDVGADGEARFPTDAEKEDVTRALYTIALATKIPAQVSASEPVVAP